MEVALCVVLHLERDDELWVLLKRVHDLVILVLHLLACFIGVDCHDGLLDFVYDFFKHNSRFFIAKNKRLGA